MGARPFSDVIARLRDAGLRPTRQRLALARLLFDGADRHVTAEQLHSDACHDNVPVALATVYNTLHQFTAAGLLRQVVVEPGRTYFDTNTDDHHHFYFEEDGTLRDVQPQGLSANSLPAPPPGAETVRGCDRRFSAASKCRQRSLLVVVDCE